MKRLSGFTFASLLALALASTTPAQAQATLSITPPSWGPAVAAGTQYYYVPEYGGYYDLREQRYIVERDGKWLRTTTLSGYSPASLHPVAIDYVGAQPWTLIGRHRTKYPASLPPGQAKRLENGKGLPPGQAKKQYGGQPGNGNGKGHGKGTGKH